MEKVILKQTDKLLAVQKKESVSPDLYNYFSSIKDIAKIFNHQDKNIDSAVGTKLQRSQNVIA